ncbi:hypothetical protein SDC9_82244 [bioreactor metagenome]|uniref:Uncharacterized protein n=1 Tax=bioreactor metagenome TaxID=1076179 RepID=A0A644Z6M3_9ZZZZ
MRNHKVRAVERAGQIGCAKNARKEPVFVQHALAELADDVQPRFVDIRQAQLIQREQIAPPNQPLHELGTICTACADNR